jgi:protein SCO1/2
VSSTFRRLVAGLLAVGLAAAACRSSPPARRYELVGQILVVHAQTNYLTVKHDDIPGFMPGMTMNFAVAPASLMAGRTPGEMIRATLEVTDNTATIVAIERTGIAPLPEPGAEPMAAILLNAGDQVPDAAFVDQDDRRRAFSEWKGSFTVLTFIYTKCPLPTYCPLMDQNFTTLQRAVAEDPALRGRVRLVSVSFDPAVDTPAVLRAHATRRKADPAVWTFLTGDRVTIERFAARFGVSLMRTPPDAREITHNLRTALVGRDGRILKLYTGNQWTPSALLADLRAAARDP